jgi:hypothetical protein
MLTLYREELFGQWNFTAKTLCSILLSNVPEFGGGINSLHELFNSKTIPKAARLYWEKTFPDLIDLGGHDQSRMR